MRDWHRRRAAALVSARAADEGKRRQFNLKEPLRLFMKHTEVHPRTWFPLDGKRYKRCATETVPAKAGRGVDGEVELVVEFRVVFLDGNGQKDVDYRYRDDDSLKDARKESLHEPPIRPYETRTKIDNRQHPTLKWDPIYLATGDPSSAAAGSRKAFSSEERRDLLIRSWHAKWDPAWPERVNNGVAVVDNERKCGQGSSE